tara:strand:+ start:338 stop:460 length:123 start_codon:yes stop_codon:yes gene_type:complete
MVLGCHQDGHAINRFSRPMMLIVHLDSKTVAQDAACRTIF